MTARGRHRQVEGGEAFGRGQAPEGPAAGGGGDDGGDGPDEQARGRPELPVGDRRPRHQGQTEREARDRGQVQPLVERAEGQQPRRREGEEHGRPPPQVRPAEPRPRRGRHPADDQRRDHEVADEVGHGPLPGGVQQCCSAQGARRPGRRHVQERVDQRGRHRDDGEEPDGRAEVVQRRARAAEPPDHQGRQRRDGDLGRDVVDRQEDGPAEGDRLTLRPADEEEVERRRGRAEHHPGPPVGPPHGQQPDAQAHRRVDQEDIAVRQQPRPQHQQVREEPGQRDGEGLPEVTHAQEGEGAERRAWTTGSTILARRTDASGHVPRASQGGRGWHRDGRPCRCITRRPGRGLATGRGVGQKAELRGRGGVVTPRSRQEVYRRSGRPRLWGTVGSRGRIILIPERRPGGLARLNVRSGTGVSPRIRPEVAWLKTWQWGAVV